MGFIVGLIIWYLCELVVSCPNDQPLTRYMNYLLPTGNVKSSGNPYGSTASFGVFLLPMVFIRVFAPPQYFIAILMFSVGYCYLYLRRSQTLIRYLYSQRQLLSLGIHGLMAICLSLAIRG